MQQEGYMCAVGGELAEEDHSVHVDDDDNMTDWDLRLVGTGHRKEHAEHVAATHRRQSLRPMSIRRRTPKQKPDTRHHHNRGHFRVRI